MDAVSVERRDLRVLEDVVLRAVAEVVEVGVEGRGERAFEHLHTIEEEGTS